MAAQPAQWIGTPHIKGSNESVRMMLLTFSLIGLSFTWGTETAYCTPYLLQLGLTKSQLSLVWIAGPLSGLIMQPIVGIMADKSKNKFGRRRPVMVVATAIVSVCLLILGWTGEIVGIFIGEGDLKRNATIFVAVLAIYALDFAINALQSSCRSLIVDTLPVPKQQLGSAWASRMGAIGHLMGYGAGALDLGSIFGTLIGDTQFKQLTVVATVTLNAAIGITCWATHERVLVSDGSEGQHGLGIVGTMVQLFHTVRQVPHRIQAICWVQFWSWIGWFFFLFYNTQWVGETYLRYDAPPELRDSKDTLKNIGRVGSMSLVIFSIVTFAASVSLPWLVKSPDNEEEKPPFTPRPPATLAPVLHSIYRFRPTLLTAWTYSHLIFSFAMIFTPFVATFRSATFLVAMCGIPWAMAIWAPFTFMGIEINRSSTTATLPTANAGHNRNASYVRVPEDDVELNDFEPDILHLRQGSVTSLDAETNDSTGELAGVYLGILNLYTTAPQFIATGISMVVFSILEPGKSPELAKDAHPDEHHSTDGPNAIAVCFFIGALSSVGAAYATRRLRYIR